LTDSVATRSREDWRKVLTEKPKGDLEFAALMRKIDDADDNYRN